MSDTNPSWHPDPTGKHDHRYWDGTQWTEHVSDAGIASVDPLEAAAPTATEEPVAEQPVAEEPDASDAALAEPEAPAPVDPTAVEPIAVEPSAVEPSAVDSDATATWPTASGTPAAWPTSPVAPGAPAPPPPYVPGEPVSARSSSKRGLVIGGGILAAVAVTVIAVMALGGGDDNTPSVRTQVVSRAHAAYDLNSSDSECVADLLIDQVGEGALEDATSDAVAQAVDDVGVQTIVDECNIDEAALTGGGGTTDTTDGTTDTTEITGADGTYGSDPALDALYDSCADGDFAACDQLYLDSDAGSEYETFGDTCGNRNEPGGYCVDIYGEDGNGGSATVPGTGIGGADLPANFEETLADTYETMLELDRDRAECLAGKLTDAIESGTLGADQVMSEFMNYLSDCDISLEEIGAN